MPASGFGPKGYPAGPADDAHAAAIPSAFSGSAFSGNPFSGNPDRVRRSPEACAQVVDAAAAPARGQVWSGRGSDDGVGAVVTAATRRALPASDGNFE